MSNSLRIKNRYLLGLGSWLSILPLGGRESRERSRFVQIASDALVQMEKERKELIDKYAEKEEDGVTLKKTVDNGMERYVIPPEKTADLEREYAELLDEDFVLDIGEGHKAKIRTVRDILLNTDYKFGPAETDSPEEKAAKIRQAADYDKWCEAFETLDIDA